LSLKNSKVDVADMAMAATVLVWAGNNVIVKAALHRIGPYPYVFSRLLIVSVLLFIWLRFKRVDVRIRRKDIPLFVVCGVAGFAFNNIVFTVGLKQSSAFTASVLVATGPIFAMIFAVMARIERVRPVQWCGAVVAFVGVAVFVNIKIDGNPIGFGELLIILSAALFAVYSLAIRPLIVRYGSPAVTAWSALFGFLTAFPFTVGPAMHQDWGALGLAGWSALFYSSVISMLVSYTIWGWAIQKRGVGRTVVFLFFVPVVTGVLSVLVLNEQITKSKAIGAALVLVGVGLARLRFGGTVKPASAPIQIRAQENECADA
jgi:drug/metabolite transporter (DMT)-like permease